VSLAFRDDEAARRRLLWAMPTGLYVLGSAGSEAGPYNLMTHSLAVQAATEPCVLALAVDRTARTHELVGASGRCSLSVLHRAQRAVVRRFVKPVERIEADASGRPMTMSGEPVGFTPSGVPYLSGAAGCLDLRVVERVEFASHTLFCAQVVGVAVDGALLEGAASERTLDVLRMEDTKMNYGG